jgi:hypothetical protein
MWLVMQLPGGNVDSQQGHPMCHSTFTTKQINGLSSMPRHYPEENAHTLKPESL